MHLSKGYLGEKTLFRHINEPLYLTSIHIKDDKHS
jgi:hypothetical protein